MRQTVAGGHLIPESGMRSWPVPAIGEGVGYFLTDGRGRIAVLAVVEKGL